MSPKFSQGLLANKIVQSLQENGVTWRTSQTASRYCWDDSDPRLDFLSLALWQISIRGFSLCPQSKLVSCFYKTDNFSYSLIKYKVNRKWGERNMGNRSPCQMWGTLQFIVSAFTLSSFSFFCHKFFHFYWHTSGNKTAWLLLWALVHWWLIRIPCCCNVPASIQAWDIFLLSCCLSPSQLYNIYL